MLSVNERLAYNILHSLSIVILRRVGAKRYEIFGAGQEFYERFFPPTEDGPCVTPWEHSSISI